MTNPQLLVLAASSQVLLTITVLLLLGARRGSAVNAGKQGSDALLNGHGRSARSLLRSRRGRLPSTSDVVA